MNPWQPQGTVYGTLLNFQREWDLWAPRMVTPPHTAPPSAPVLYIKSANTFNTRGRLSLVDGVSEVDVGASLGLVMGQAGQVQSAVLLNDWSVPHAQYFRPPVKFRCRDGFLSCGAPVPWSQVNPQHVCIQVHVNGQWVQTVDLSSMVRPVATLLADVGEFMTLQAGDVLMVGTDCLPDGTRPRARAGDRVEVLAPGLPSVTVHVKGGV